MTTAQAIINPAPKIVKRAGALEAPFTFTGIDGRGIRVGSFALVLAPRIAVGYAPRLATFAEAFAGRIVGERRILVGVGKEVELRTVGVLVAVDREIVEPDCACVDEETP